MTPCEKLGYKVGDKFEVVKPRLELKMGDIVELCFDDRTDIPLFTGGVDSGQFHLKLERVKPLPKLTKSKQWLADAIHNHGAGWPDGAKWAVQSGVSGNIMFAKCGKPERNIREWVATDGGFASFYRISDRKPQPNWHQTVLSRDEYFSVYPEVVESEPDYSPVGHCKCVSDLVLQQPDTLDTLMKRWEDAKVSVQQAHDAVAAELERRGWNEPTVLNIADWRDLKVGDVVECVEPNIRPETYAGMVGSVSAINRDFKSSVRVDFEHGGAQTWCYTVKFIRRP